ncbi:hypothetical protein HFA01_00600 [Halobacillus faecis]|uniref:Uncharacterized protein n=1 Tax=Halobacillus faecis TaxID=360184 RepID=A0A511WNC4_9BACI|nr:hypothetical protein HFA01_00600 [Halobacillus faecis]
MPVYWIDAQLTHNYNNFEKTKQGGGTREETEESNRERKRYGAGTTTYAVDQ